MIHGDWLLAVVGLFLGTYLVRSIPFWFPGIDRLPRRINRFLELVPAAALGALILPDAFLQTDSIIAVIVPTLAFGLTLARLNLTVVVAASIGIAWVGLILL